MSSVPVQVPDNLLSLVDLLTTLAATNPVVTEHVAPIIREMFDFALTSGKVHDPDVWIRAMKAAIIEIETLKADDVWLNRLPIERGE